MVMTALLLQGSAASVPAEDEIVVVARRVKEMRLTLARDGAGRVYCGLGQSTGVNAIDERLCEIARTCAKKKTPLVQVALCVEKKKPQLIAQILRAAGLPKDRLNYHAEN